MAYRVACIFVINIGANKQSSCANLVTERTTNQASTPTTTASFVTTKHCPVGRDGGYNSLYAIHRIGMEVERWWSYVVQSSVHFCLQYRCEQAIVVLDFSN